MSNLKDLEKQYLDAKIAYYDGIPFMSDPEFDQLELTLKNLGSKVIEQVGAKRKDFDYAHPSKMLSLSKFQTAEGNDMQVEFFDWYEKRLNQLKYSGFALPSNNLYYSPKFDGNAINIIYKEDKLYHILTRGNGLEGKNITDRLKSIVPLKLNITLGDYIEIRCEVVIDKFLFEEKYGEDSANPRNFVAGILGGDEFDEDVVNDLSIVPLIYIVDGTHIKPELLESNFSSNNFYLQPWILDIKENYSKNLKYWIVNRDKFKYQLDGMVIIFDVPYREELGENEHDPNFSVSIKMIPEIATSDVIGIEWNVGKTGELAPVVLLTPVKLAGTSVKRASGYNAGYIQNKPIRIGSKVTVCKRGDIIPAIQSILYTPEEINTSISLPTHCTDCNSELTFDGIHLMCNNEDCPGRIAKILASSLQVMKIKRIGRKTIAPFAKDFSDLVQLIVWARTKGAGDSKDIEKYDIAYNSRSHEIFLEAFNNITSLSYAKIIQSLGYTNVGKTLSLQIANEHAGVPFDYGNLEKALVESMRAPEVTYWIKYCVKSLEEVGIKVDRPFIVDTKDAIFVCLTGSPSSAGFGTKADFLDHYTGRLVECDLKDKNCNYLVTNDLDSKTSKMTTAVKKGIKIVTYKYDF